ncbi:MAG: glycosyl transferase [Frankiales bacterium]|nr:glycosyl transferase [Frankiales bacterium]
MTGKVSVIITNHNYDRWLAIAIESALAQTHPDVEVIVVDDGSTDDSLAVCAKYEDQVHVIYTANRGQAAAVNTGYQRCSGDLVIFLDADDELASNAAEIAMKSFEAEGASKVSWPMEVIDADGRSDGHRQPEAPLPSGDLSSTVLRQGPDAYVTPPMSGNAWSKRFLEQVMPMPEEDFRICADAYLIVLAPLFGSVSAVEDVLSSYRIHESSRYSSLSLEVKLPLDMVVYAARARCLVDAARRLGHEVDPTTWVVGSFMHKLDRALSHIRTLVPVGERVAVVDDNHWGLHRGFSRATVPFPSRDGVWWGRPTNDHEARQELERLRRAGIRTLVVGWPAFWWLDYYEGWHRKLRADSESVFENDVLVAFRFSA